MKALQKKRLTVDLVLPTDVDIFRAKSILKILNCTIQYLKKQISLFNQHRTTNKLIIA